MHKMFFAGGSFTYPDLIRFHPAVTANYTKPSPLEQAGISNYTIAQEPLRSTDNFGWRVTSTIEGLLLIAAILRKYRVSMTDHGRPGACGAFNRAGQGWDLVELSIARLIRCAFHIVT
jgi:hypothetical protein